MFFLAAAIVLQSPTYQTLQSDSVKDPAAHARVEASVADAGRAYNGDKPLPFHVEVVSPIELVDPVTGRRTKPGAKPEPPAAGEPVAAPSPEPAGRGPRVETGDPAGAGDGPPTYHFEGKRPMGGLTIYTPVRDQAGRDNRTRAAGGGGGLLGLLKWVALAALAVLALALLL
ncbi:MAG: hypothetical protein HY553_01650 [Elusimicrobia bacterium]|nr:hypothetical protein [Elusimicrobiota bacterium]